MSELARMLAPDDRLDVFRKLGGLLVGSGLFLVFARKADSTLGEAWGDWALLLVLLLAFGFLYGGGLAARRTTGELRSWEAVYLVFGLLLAPFVLFQFVEAIDGNAGAPLNVAWIFLATAALALAAAQHNLRYGYLLGAIALIVSWSALWDEILSDGLAGDLGLYRGLLLAIAAVFLAAAIGLRASGRQTPAEPLHDLVTGAAIAAVAAGAISFTTLFVQASPFLVLPSADSTFFWEVVLLVVSLAAIVYGARSGVRGPAYVGAIGLFLFVIIAGGDLNDESPEGKIVGWPLALIVLGLGALAASAAPQTGLPGRGEPTAAAPPPPPPPAPPPAGDERQGGS